MDADAVAISGLVAGVVAAVAATAATIVATLDRRERRRQLFTNFAGLVFNRNGQRLEVEFTQYGTVPATIMSIAVTGAEPDKVANGSLPRVFLPGKQVFLFFDVGVDAEPWIQITWLDTYRRRVISRWQSLSTIDSPISQEWRRQMRERRDLPPLSPRKLLPERRTARPGGVTSRSTRWPPRSFDTTEAMQKVRGDISDMARVV